MQKVPAEYSPVLDLQPTLQPETHCSLCHLNAKAEAMASRLQARNLADAAAAGGGRSLDMFLAATNSFSRLRRIFSLALQAEV